MFKKVASSISVSWDALAGTAAASTRCSSMTTLSWMQLHSFKADHHHGRIGDPDSKPYGNGVLLWFEVEDFDAALLRVEELKAEIVLPKHRNPPDGNGGPNHWEIWLRDPDGNGIVLASPYNSAG